MRSCRAWCPRGRGAILQVASSAAFQPIPRQSTYAATKAFVLSLSEALHTELKPRGITVTALCPGPVRTEFMEVAGMEEAASSSPDFVWVDADECAAEAVRGLERGKRVVDPEHRREDDRGGRAAHAACRAAAGDGQVLPGVVTTARPGTTRWSGRRRAPSPGPRHSAGSDRPARGAR